MKLYTVQPREVLNQIINTGEYICDDKKSISLNDNDPYKRFYNAYDWLVKKMNEKIKNPEDIKYPVWAWYQYGETPGLPDLNKMSEIVKDDVLIEIEIPDEDVVLTGYNDWHSVLNDGYLNIGETDEEFDKLSDWYHSLDPITREEEKEKSWDNIFDVTNLKYIQATFWKISKDMIVSVIDLKESIEPDTMIYYKENEDDFYTTEEMLRFKNIKDPKILLDNYIRNYIVDKQFRMGYKNYFNEKDNKNNLDKIIEANSIKIDDKTLSEINKAKKLYNLDVDIEQIIKETEQQL